MTARESTIWEALSEEELLMMHSTSPKEMDNSSRLRQHDNVHKQIAAFEKLLQHSINRFSADKLYQMLQTLISHLPYIPPTRRSKHYDESREEISSLAQLREIMLDFKDPKKTGIEKDEQAHVSKYFNTFFEDILYLMSLKRYFDERIYMCLYDYFYDPMDDLMNPQDTLDREKRGRVSFDEGDSGHSSLKGSDLEEKVSDRYDNDHQVENELEFYFDRLMEDEKLSLSVRKMFELNERWDCLFDEDEIDPTLFDPDSKHEILQFSNYEQFELILRLIPDIFVKAYKSIEIAKLWWTQANKINENIPQKLSKRRTENEIKNSCRKLENKIVGLRDEIRTNEDLLMMQSEDIRNLNDRDRRYINLSEQCENLEDKKNVIGEQYNEFIQYRDQLKRRLEKLDPHGPSYRETLQQLKECERKFYDAQIELRMLSFQFQLVQSDFLVELDMRPDMIRFQNDAQMKLDETSTTIWKKNEEVKEQEKKLTLLRTNCERMKKIMRKYLLTMVEPKNQSKDDGKKFKKRAGDEKKATNEDHGPGLHPSPNEPDWDYYSDPHDKSRAKGEQEKKPKPPKEKKKSKDKGGKENRGSKSKDKETDENPKKSLPDDGNDADTETPTPGGLPTSRVRIHPKHQFD